MLKLKGQIINGEIIALEKNGNTWNIFHYDKNHKVEIVGMVKNEKRAERIYREKVEMLKLGIL